MRSVIASLVLLAVLPVATAAQGGIVFVTLDSASRHQTITGWEATTYVGQGSAEFSRFSHLLPELFDRAVDELGITRLRLEVRSSAEHRRDLAAEYAAGALDYATFRCMRYSTINDNDDPNVADTAGFHFSDLDSRVEIAVLPLRERLEARGGRLHLNLCYVAFTGQMRASGCDTSLRYHHDDPEEYAEFVLAVYRHLDANYGLVPDTWEVILEPDNTREWDGGLLGRAIVAAGRRLREAGYTPRFVAPSTTRMSNAPIWFDAMIATPGVVGMLEEIAYHRYGGVSGANLQAIAARADTHGVRTSMLEHIGTGHADLHDDLTIGGVSAWAQYTLASTGQDDGGAYYLFDLSDSLSPRILSGSRTLALRHYFRSARPGAVRIGARSTSATVRPVAFINSDGRYAVVTTAGGGERIEVNGLPAGVYTVRANSGSERDVVTTGIELDAGGALRIGGASAGVISIEQTSGATSSVRDRHTPSVTVEQRGGLLQIGSDRGIHAAHVSIYDARGMLVSLAEWQIPAAIDCSALAAGVYHVRVTAGSAELGGTLLLLR